MDNKSEVKKLAHRHLEAGTAVGELCDQHFPYPEYLIREEKSNKVLRIAHGNEFRYPGLDQTTWLVWIGKTWAEILACLRSLPEPKPVRIQGNVRVVLNLTTPPLRGDRTKEAAVGTPDDIEDYIIGRYGDLVSDVEVTDHWLV